MKFTCDKDVLLEALTISSRCISSKSTIPILEGFYINCTDELQITGYNLELGAIVSLSATILEMGSTIINAKILTDIIRALDNGAITIESLPDNKIKITSGHSEFSIASYDSDEYPDIPSIESNDNFSLTTDEFKKLLSRTTFAISTDESRPIHTGGLFEIEGNNLKIVALDGFKLALANSSINNSSNIKTSFVVPGKALNEIKTMMKDMSSVKISVTDKNIIFETDNIKMFSRLIEGEFLNYKAAIPTTHSLSLKVNTHDLNASIKRVSPIINEITSSPLRFNFDLDTLKISCTSSLGYAYDEVSLLDSNAKLEIGFNNKYIQAALSACNEENILLKMQSPTLPLIITPTNNDNFLFMVLPVRLRNE